MFSGSCAKIHSRTSSTLQSSVHFWVQRARPDANNSRGGGEGVQIASKDDGRLLRRWPVSNHRKRPKNKTKQRQFKAEGMLFTVRWKDKDILGFIWNWKAQVFENEGAPTYGGPYCQAGILSRHWARNVYFTERIIKGLSNVHLCSYASSSSWIKCPKIERPWTSLDGLWEWLSSPTRL